MGESTWHGPIQWTLVDGTPLPGLMLGDGWDRTKGARPANIRIIPTTRTSKVWHGGRHGLGRRREALMNESLCELSVTFWQAPPQGR